VYGFETELAKSLGAQVGTKVGKVAEGTPSPAELYSEAAPRVVKALKQYDAASPIVDFATRHWYLVAVGVFLVGVGAGLTANFIYDKLRRGKR
jgi:hypothetical protein